MGRLLMARQRHLRLVAEGGELIGPPPAVPAPAPKISIDASLIDRVIDLLDGLLMSRREQ
jgi:hypothetical protein